MAKKRRYRSFTDSHSSDDTSSRTRRTFSRSARISDAIEPGLSVSITQKPDTVALSTVSNRSRNADSSTSVDSARSQISRWSTVGLVNTLSVVTSSTRAVCCSALQVPAGPVEVLGESGEHQPSISGHRRPRGPRCPSSRRPATSSRSASPRAARRASNPPGITSMSSPRVITNGRRSMWRGAGLAVDQGRVPRERRPPPARSTRADRPRCGAAPSASSASLARGPMITS